MKRLLSMLLALVGVRTGMAAETESGLPAAHRERIEWTDIWIPGADAADKPHVLLVGDSITKNYYGGVEKRLRPKAYTARLTTSICVADPVFLPMLRSVLETVSFDVIHFNNGLHGVDYTEAAYRRGYEAAVRLIREVQPHARLILALSTPIRTGSPKEALNRRVDERNRLVREIAKQVGCPVDDLNTPMRNHPEYHRDPYHYKGEAIAIQARQVADQVEKILAAKPASP